MPSGSLSGAGERLVHKVLAQPAPDHGQDRAIDMISWEALARL